MNTANSNNLNKAIVYVRVSTKEQVEEGNSLSTQEKICRDYARHKGYDIAEVFIEQGESAKTADRTELQKLLRYCSEKKNNIKAVIIYRLDRLSRNTDDYSQLRLLLKRYGVEIKSTSEHFENNPVGRFMENTMANIAQFDNDIRAERCSGGMKEAMRDGRYVWGAPVGYSNVRVLGKATIAQNDMAPLVRETFELVAENNHSLEDVRQIMEKRGLVLKSGKPLGKPYFYQLFHNRTYMGLIEKFGESHKGNFEPIVKEDLFNQVQRVLKNRGKKMSNYKRDCDDFPLRRFAFSAEGRKITGSWSQGGNKKKYPFYNFGLKGSNLKRDDVHDEFKSFLETYSFKEEHIVLLKEEMQKKLVKAGEKERKEADTMRKRLSELEQKQGLLVQKNLDGVISDVILKQQLEHVEKEMFELGLLLATKVENEQDPIELISFAETYLKNPSAVWEKVNLDTKLKLQWFEFPSGIVFEDKKFRTPQVASIFNAKSAFLDADYADVDYGDEIWKQITREIEYLMWVLKDNELNSIE
jgi:DNA invertase Pin-like site-specific DNA recombinase